MEFSIDKSVLQEVVTRAIFSSQPLSEMITFSLNPIYFILPSEQAFPIELGVPPVVDCVGDLREDIEFVLKEHRCGVRDPDYLLEIISRIFLAISASSNTLRIEGK